MKKETENMRNAQYFNISHKEKGYLKTTFS